MWIRWSGPSSAYAGWGWHCDPVGTRRLRRGDHDHGQTALRAGRAGQQRIIGGGVAATGTFDISQARCGRLDQEPEQAEDKSALEARPLALTTELHDTSSQELLPLTAASRSQTAHRNICRRRHTYFSGAAYPNTSTLAVRNDAALGTGTLTFQQQVRCRPRSIELAALGDAAVSAANRSDRDTEASAWPFRVPNGVRASSHRPAPVR